MAIRTRHRVAGVVVACVALAFAMTACGAEDPDVAENSTATTSTNGNSGDAGNPLSSYLACMRDNGAAVTMPSGAPASMPSGGPGGIPSSFPQPSGSAAGGFPGADAMFAKPDIVSQEDWERAQSACASALPSR